MMAGGNGGQLSVPPGFRFHPTDEELLYYYLRKKVSYEAIDLDVIREVDLNKLEPWDLKEKCRIGSGPQNEWYFFSHKDKKYPTGTRTNRATTAGFWKATGRDKAIHLSSNSKRIGMRKTLVFYTGRAPHGQKTDWIMHEYRLDDVDDDTAPPQLQQEDGWVVCRVFKKKNLVNNNNNKGSSLLYQQQQDEGHHMDDHSSIKSQQHSMQLQALLIHDNVVNNTSSACNYPPLLFDHHSNGGGGGMHLPQLFSPEVLVPNNSGSSSFINSMDMECSQSLLRLTSMQQSAGNVVVHGGGGGGSDWSFLDKLLASHSHHPGGSSNQQLVAISNNIPVDHDLASSAQKFPFQYLGFETDILKFSK